MNDPRADHPLLYEVHAHVWLNEQSRAAGRSLALDEIPEAALARLAELGCSWLWLMGVWQTGPRGRQLARSHPDLRRDYDQVLPGWTDADVVGSPYAIARYEVHQALGGPAALAGLRRRLARHGLRLMLDFVPNHTAADHHWVSEHPGYYVAGDPADVAAGRAFAAPSTAAGGPRFICHGKDPYFPPWTDTAQLDCRRPETVAALAGQLLAIAEQCDGVRCDMAMLVLSDVFARTWGPADPPGSGGREPWAALIDSVRARSRNFVLAAEAYWGLEDRLLKEGFTWAYDKVLYDRLRHDPAGRVREHLAMDERHHGRCLRFIENHDEPRAASAFPRERHQAAALLCATVPGAWLLHHQQLAGYTKRVPVQLGRFPEEPGDGVLAEYYARLLEILRRARIRSGTWTPLACRPAWDGNPTSDAYLAHAWIGGAGALTIVALNFGPTQGQCYIDLRRVPLPGEALVLTDELHQTRYERSGRELLERGLYCDRPAWGGHLFTVRAA